MTTTTLRGTCLGLLAAGLLALAPGLAAQEPERPLVFIPGMLGSKLCRHEGGTETVIWGTLGAIRHIDLLAHRAGADGVRACGLIREVAVLGPLQQDVYGPILDRLEREGYREGETLFVFDHDWRLSVFDNAARLAEFAEARLPPGRFDIVAHSMGGLIARVYLVEASGAARVQRLVTAGTPWWGSVRVFELLEFGYGPATGLVGGIDVVRRTLSSFPSLYELAPAYEGCCAGDGAFDPAQPSTWQALGWHELDQGVLPDFAQVGTRKARLAEIVAAPLPAGVEEAAVIGVDHRTAEKIELTRTGDGWQVSIRTGWSGDGVVVPASSRGDRVAYPTSFSGHQAILSDPDVQDFVLAALRHGPDAAMASVPVRPRDEIATALGRLVALVGVAVVPDAPAYSIGDEVVVRVILRPAELDPVQPSTVTLRARHPDGTTRPVALERDPVGTDNPFEQVFVGRLPIGSQPGTMVLRAELDVARAADRIVELAFPILPR